MVTKYRQLTLEELNLLEKEFVDFLVINGITPDEWESLKGTDQGKVERILSLFSEVVFEQILRGVKFLERIEANQILTFQCLADKLVLVGLRGNGQLDFTKQPLDTDVDWKECEVFMNEKLYQSSRENELFDMIEHGAQISDGQLFKKLCLLL